MISFSFINQYKITSIIGVRFSYVYYERLSL